MASALLIALLAFGAPLFARGSEGWFGLAPCELCLWQRWPYWVAGGLALLGVFLWRRPALRLAGLAAAISAAIGAFHLGVEFGWWPSPLPGCQAPTSGGAMSVEDMLRSLAPTPNKPCDQPAYLIPGFPLSMAGMNLIYGVSLAVLAWRLAQKEPRA
ncbi:disulfide bond formation protein B [Sediminicoccus rosea]|jgi:disulfide bond formation protein DsbB|uniref:Disulfide bond formation protein B n=1 Tax=Sediminicoccus rosea TaxID=1225128 RepID=A0ABZ0PQ85_9PROT|nr:disulfide bond formation protein B [Sediminicoccus rosea]WPB87428.1 disulfide bond formation protein B [Sediminicoccus rosea]